MYTETHFFFYSPAEWSGVAIPREGGRYHPPSPERYATAATELIENAWSVIISLLLQLLCSKPAKLSAEKTGCYAFVRESAFSDDGDKSPLLLVHTQWGEKCYWYELLVREYNRTQHLCFHPPPEIPSDTVYILAFPRCGEVSVDRDHVFSN